jgi:hypothetical protein
MLTETPSFMDALVLPAKSISVPGQHVRDFVPQEFANDEQWKEIMDLFSDFYGFEYNCDKDMDDFVRKVKRKRPQASLADRE